MTLSHYSTLNYLHKPLRRNTGSAITELGPAIFIIFIFAFFPMLDLIFLGFSYCACQTLNNLQVAQAAKITSAQAQSDNGDIKKVIPETWTSTGLGSFVGLTELPITKVSYKEGPQTVYGNDYYVTVNTTVSVRPFLAIPFLPGIPGLHQPAVFAISGRKLVENYRFVQPEFMAGD
jgi:hypothetical protein